MTLYIRKPFLVNLRISSIEGALRRLATPENYMLRLHRFAFSAESLSETFLCSLHMIIVTPFERLFLCPHLLLPHLCFPSF